MINDEQIMTLLIRASEKGISVFQEAGKLKFKVIKGQKVDPEIVQQLKLKKEEILNLLKKISKRKKEEIHPRDKGKTQKLPLSFAQERLWFIHQLEGSLQYHQPSTIHLGDTIDSVLLEKALKFIVDRHEVLRTVIKEDAGQPYQQILASKAWSLAFTDYSQSTNDPSRISKEDLITTEHTRPFDLAKDYMLRAHLIKQESGTYLLILVTHHIASDGWSKPIFFKELAQSYQALLKGEELNWPPLSIQYADYAIWERSNFSTHEITHQLEWWEAQLSELKPLLLPTDYPRGVVKSTKGSGFKFFIEKPIQEQLLDLSIKSEATLYMTLFAVFKILLFRYTGQKDICIGTTVSGRDIKSLEPLIGFFAKTIAIRTKLKPEASFLDLLQQLKTDILYAFSNQEAPFEQIVRRVEKGRSHNSNPIFQLLFSFQNQQSQTTSSTKTNELNFEAPKQEETQFELNFSVASTDKGINIGIAFSSDLYKRSTIKKFAEHYQALLKSILANPNEKINQLSTVCPNEKKALLFDFNNTTTLYPNQSSIIELFETQVKRHPHHAALVYKGKEMTYETLNNQANKLANYLNETYQLQSDDLVGLLLKRSDYAIIAILGILKTGAAYVPIDVNYPFNRKRFIAKDTACKVLIIQSEDLIDVSQFEVDCFAIDVQLEKLSNQKWQTKTNYDLRNLAYVIYTSGSTGLPKGVMIEQQSLLNYLFFSLEKYRKGDTPLNFPLFTSLSFDLTQTSIYLSLLSGGTLYIESSDKTDQVLKRIIENEEINSIKLTPAHTHFLEGLQNSSLKTLIIGGEALTKQHVEKILQVNPTIPIFNEYGPTEATIGCMLYQVETVDHPILIGRPIANTEIYLLDDQRNVVGMGMIGEIGIGGAGLARAYLNRPELSRKKFISHPYKEDARLYLSGDLARILEDGQLQYLGRKDEQLKINGFRIEPEEIEHLLLNSDYVNSCTVVAKSDMSGNKQLIGYVVLKEPISTDVLLNYLAKKLPKYMIPSFIIELEALPLTINGKINKEALPQPEWLKRGGEYLAPQTILEKKLTSIWEAILQIDKIGIEDNFFHLGGHSLLAMKVIAKIKKDLNLNLVVADIFDHPTIRSLSQHTASAVDDDGIPPLTAVPKATNIPLSYAQERLWFIDQFEGSTHFHLPTILHIKEPLNAAHIETAFRHLVDRHPVLRTIIKTEAGKPYQRLIPSTAWKLDSLENQKPLAEKALKQVFRSIIAHPFDLSSDFMLRGHLIKQSATDYYLIIVIHHIASDGWSNAILVKDLMEFYHAALEGRLPNLIPLEIQYTDYAIWERKYLSGDRLATRIDWWKNQLKGYQNLMLPTDFKRPKMQSLKGADISFEFDKKVVEKLRSLALETGTSLYMVILASFQVFLHRYTSQSDICIGTPVANRREEGTQNLVGFFTNTVVIRSMLQQNMTFLSFLDQVKEATLAALSYQDVPFGHIVKKIVNDRDISQSPIFQAMFIMNNNWDTPELKLGERTLSYVSAGDRMAKYDLTLLVTETPNTLKMGLLYCADLFLPATAKKMVHYFKNVLQSIASNYDQEVQQISFLSESERDKLLYKDFAVGLEFKHQNLVHFFEKQVEANPNKTALVFKDQELSYSQLNVAANQLAHYLKEEFQVRSNDLVGVMIERSHWAVISILGILKAGAAYVPIDPGFPEERRNYIIADTQLSILVTHSQQDNRSQQGKLNYIEIDQLLNTTSGKNKVHNLSISIPSNSLAYVIYTSGSTGQPKGVLIEHKGICNTILSQKEVFQITADSRCTQFFSFSFDASVLDLFTALLSGAKLYILPEQMKQDPLSLVRYIRQHQIDVVTLLAVYFNQLNVHDLAGVKTLVLGGDKAEPEKVNTFLQYGNCFNSYGPTETSVCATVFKLEKGQSDISLIPIGKPISNTQIYILDELGQLVPEGQVGEIYISGSGIARGYLNQPELTESKFQFHSFSRQANTKMYRTGDMACWLPDGNIDFRGRKDDQVKIRGYRIELREIEAVILQVPMIDKCVITTHKESSSQKLIAYIVQHNQPFNQEALLTFLRIKLPEYMLPDLFIPLETLPLNAIGKVDKSQLPLPNINHSNQPFLAPRNETEKILANIFKNLLHLDRVGVHDNFFQIGGDSINAIQVIYQINQRLKVELSLVRLFQYPTIIQLSNWINTGTDTNKSIFSLNEVKQALPNLFLIPPIVGTPIVFKDLAVTMNGEYNCYGLQYQGMYKEEALVKSIVHLAIRFKEAITSIQKEGTIFLLGYSMGAIIAYELAYLLEQEGHQVCLILLDREPVSKKINPKKTDEVIQFYLQWLGKKEDFLLQKETAFSSIERFLYHNVRLLHQHKIKGAIRGPILAIEAQKDRPFSIMTDWASFTTGSFQHFKIEGSHHELLSTENSLTIGSLLKKHLNLQLQQ